VATEAEGDDAEILARLIAPLAGAEARDRAHRLLAQFGGLARLFQAPEAALQAASRDRPDIAFIVGLLSRLVDRATGVQGKLGAILSSPESVLHYLGREMERLRVETLRVLFLDGDNRLLADDVMAQGSVRTLTFHPREIIRRALECDATGMILVHNHPAAAPVASAEDIRATRLTAELAGHLDLTLHDHLVIGRTGWSSMRADGHVQ
jgi:DNA repair protein RadC